MSCGAHRSILKALRGLVNCPSFVRWTGRRCDRYGEVTAQTRWNDRPREPPRPFHLMALRLPAPRSGIHGLDEQDCVGLRHRTDGVVPRLDADQGPRRMRPSIRASSRTRLSSGSRWFTTRAGGNSCSATSARSMMKPLTAVPEPRHEQAESITGKPEGLNFSRA